MRMHFASGSPEGDELMEQLLHYATKRIVELEMLLLVDVSETVWPAEVGMVYG